MPKNASLPDWEQVLSAAARLQQLLPDAGKADQGHILTFNIRIMFFILAASLVSPQVAVTFQAAHVQRWPKTGKPYYMLNVKM
jgi:hypothetical protein